MGIALRDYYYSMHNAKPRTKLDYLTRLKKYGAFLKSKGIEDFKDIKDRKIVDEFPTKYDKIEAKNSYISGLKTFYKWLKHTNH